MLKSAVAAAVAKALDLEDDIMSLQNSSTLRGAACVSPYPAIPVGCRSQCGNDVIYSYGNRLAGWLSAGPRWQDDAAVALDIPQGVEKCQGPFNFHVWSFSSPPQILTRHIVSL